MDTSKLSPRRLTRLTGAVMAGALMLIALVACDAGGGGGEDESPSIVEPTTGPPTDPTRSSEPTEPEESDMPSETPHLDPSTGSDKPGSKSEMTITGTIESGVESGCLILDYQGTVYGIFGEYDKSVVYSGAEVTLHGHPDPSMMSFCQQGTPFMVEQAEPAG
ncbi:hypothetical protein L0U85_17260 [Glycomyces sp. L485]|uniref:hypothetical protein n=1 Tax=Glycomyces sp. L485 TaxID=2909235 RepID=UPI001F4A4021|nr:hypothetical protein [Glycomyces sp. L485]MCH7232588.1 hypothetical protein [Glycomyces sp. L485]